MTNRFTLVINPGTEIAMEIHNLTRTAILDRIFDFVGENTITFKIHPYHEVNIESLPSEKR